jgi:hypothetical protein
MFLRTSTFLSLLGAAALGAGTPAAVLALTHVQTDWSGGPGETAPVTAWTDRFATDAAVSWRSVPGQLALGSFPAAPSGAFVTSTAPLCRTVAAGDLDGDGDQDLMTALPLISFPGTGEVRWYENAGDGVTFTEHVVDPDFYGGNAVTSADLDGDGDQDMVAAAFYGNPQEDGRYVWYENVNGDGLTWTKRLIAGMLWGTQMVDAVDLDQDGDLDVLGSSTLTSIGNLNDDVYWFENVNGDGLTWTQRAIDASFPDAIESDAADIDGDGDPDVACVSYGTHEMAWWENDGDGGLTWTKHTISSFTTVDNAISLVDLDDDGDPDVVAAGQNSPVIGWFENVDGKGGSWTGHTIGTLPDGTDVEVADLDGDGLLDVLAANTDASFSQVYWFRNLGGALSWSLNVVNQGHDSGIVALPVDLDGDGALEVVFTEEGSFAGDVSGIHRREIVQFSAAGDLESAVLDAGGAADWMTIDWDAVTPAGTALALQVRSSNDPGDLGPWSADITSPGSLAGILASGTRYAQYRVLMSTPNPAVSPRVREVTLESESAATAVPGSTAAGGVLALAAPWPNPSTGASAVQLSLPEAAAARLDVVDVRGRLVATPLDGALPAGPTRVELPELGTGVYFLRLRAAGETVARKLVVR